jgi:hypothetical protein
MQKVELKLNFKREDMILQVGEFKIPKGTSRFIKREGIYNALGL